MSTIYIPLLLVVQTDVMYVHVCVCITSQDEELHVSSVPRLCTVTSYVYPTFKNLHTTKTIMSCLCKSDNGGRGALGLTVLKPRRR